MCCKFKVGQLVQFFRGGKVYKIRRVSVYDMVLLEEYETRIFLRGNWVPADRLQPVTFYQPLLPM